MTEPPTRLTASIGPAAGGLTEADVVIPVGPRNPALTGALRLALTVEDDRIVSADPYIGYVHRGAEKLFEVRDYRQILMLVNRHDWLSAFNSEIGLAMAVERLLGVEVPERAIWLRTLLAEIGRALHHLAHLQGDPLESGDDGAVEAATDAREALQAVMDDYSGGRVHFMANRVGGLLHDVGPGWDAQVGQAVAGVRAALPAVERLIRGPSAEALTGVGVLSSELVAEYGVTGPAARASGSQLDLRRDEPYLSYAELPVPLVSSDEGDCVARFGCLVDELAATLDLVEACLDQVTALPAGPVAARLPPTVRAPEGHIYVWTESPAGINGYYLVSQGERTPWRLKLRTAGFNNVAVLPQLLVGCRVRELVPILGSLFFVIGDVDK
jgi:NADH-quinone oxidoreductase subunit D